MTCRLSFHILLMMCAAREREPGGETHGVLERTGRRATLTDDVECGAVRRCREHRCQTARHGHAPVEALQLGRDLALVVIHDEDAVVLAGERLEKNGVGRERTTTADAARSRRSDGWCDDVDLLAS